MTDVNKPNFIQIDPKADEELLVNKYLKLTKQKELFPAQSERILISLIAYYANLVKNEFNEAARLNLVKHSHSPILELIGGLFGCERLQPQCGDDVLEIEIFEPFSSDLTIDKGLEIQTKDGKYIFKTTEDVIIPSGETTVTVPIKSEAATSAVNAYGSGDINILIKPFSYIKKVTNINGVTGGLDEESEESYIERILMAPESYTCAGSYGAYIYHTKSSHQDIVDVEAESPQLPAEVKIDNEAFEGFEIDYKTGTLTFEYEGHSFTIIIPPAASVFVYPLVKENGALFDVVKKAVENKLEDRECMPMTDNINVVEPTAVERKINIKITLENNTNTSAVKEQVNEVLKEFSEKHRKTLNTSLVPLSLLTLLGNIKGVFDVDLGDFKNIETAKINDYLVITTEVTYK